jgi:hypothetical protein
MSRLFLKAILAAQPERKSLGGMTNGRDLSALLFGCFLAVVLSLHIQPQLRRSP